MSKSHHTYLLAILAIILILAPVIQTRILKNHHKNEGKGHSHKFFPYSWPVTMVFMDED
jgi:hypothetical protein